MILEEESPYAEKSNKNSETAGKKSTTGMNLETPILTCMYSRQKAILSQDSKL